MSWSRTKKRGGFNRHMWPIRKAKALDKTTTCFMPVFHLEPSIHHLCKPLSNIYTPLPWLLTHFEAHGPWIVSQLNRKRYLRQAEFSFIHHRLLTMDPSIWDILFVVVWPWVPKKVYSFLVFVRFSFNLRWMLNARCFSFFSFRLLHFFLTPLETATKQTPFFSYNVYMPPMVTRIEVYSLVL